MFFKKKKKDPEDNKQWYSLIIMTQDEMYEDEYEGLSEVISDQVDNVGFTCNLIRKNTSHGALIEIDQKINTASDPCFILILINNDDIKREVELMEKQHKWKKFFGYLTPADYFEAMERANLNWDAIIYSTDNPEGIIQYLNDHSM
ncbi:hypothetical protein ELQ35_20855 [Peribacillus cavernae]|uniref:Uncharacterized protein n=1 Tax=Peribacillus cavernae TaxID=1674310 RepID=A0A3S0U9J4_9BACI|nr:hypothetical protein [Peribacillus cavernae]MDQ0221252.1 hypothetical protein [Peribacillus cavernae]RUQ25118.1 hypothetical protein ELQ35_20855 [Peribacillus cavernae]